MPFPNDTRGDLGAFHSRRVLGPDGTPAVRWESKNLKLFKVPYPLTPSFAPSQQVTRIRLHKLVGDSLVRVFEQILAHYGSLDEVKRALAHLFGGCYNFRISKNSNRLSTRAWGPALISARKKIRSARSMTKPKA